MKYLRHLSLGLFFFLLIFELSAINPQQVRYHVKPTGSDSNNGTSWGTAFQTVQKAIDMASNGDEIWVAAGTYKPTDAPDGTTSTGPTDRNNAFHFDTNIQIYGGFDGTETMLSQRDPAAHPTVLSGDFDGLDVVTGSGSTLSITNNTENAYHVLITTGLNSTAIIDGFTIKGGNADGSGSISYSGKDFFRTSGGGMNNTSSSPTLNNVTFSGNSAVESGGGMINNFSSSPTLTHVTFSGNSANSAGGGMENISFSSPSLTHVIFSGNSAADGGGGMYNFVFSSPTLTNVTFSGNSAVNAGGGISLSASSSPTLYNTVFYGNTASKNNDITGGNINASSSHNASDGTGGNIDAGTDFVNLTSDPFTNSSDPDGADDLWMTADDGLVPAPGSPLVDAGDNNQNSEPTDIAGNPRVFNTTIDIGAYESQVTPCPFTTAIYVDINATSGNNDGTSWTDAYTDLQDAIDNHCGGVEIWVAQGTYLPTDAPDGTTSTGPTDRNNAFHFDTNIQIYGGFDGTETMLSQRDPAAHPTVLSGDFDGLDVVTGSGSTLSITNNTENAYHVLITAGLNSTAIIDGFTIKGGNANGSGGISYSGEGLFRGGGGGMYNASSSPTLTHVTFSGNAADFYGGGMENSSSSPTLTKVTFSSNAANQGGGMNNNSSSPTLTHVTFSGNAANNGPGGGMNNNSSSPTLTHVTFSGNSAIANGGGMYNFSSSSPTLTHVIFSGNSAGANGGGVFNQSSSPTLTHVAFSGNSADVNGGGMGNESSSPTLTNITFSGNSADVNGGGMGNTFSTPTLYNTVFYGNTATIANDSDIAGDNINTASSHNASDGTGGNIGAGTGFVALTSDPFTNSSDPDGADDLWMTADDGLVPAAGSPLVDAGDNNQNSEPTDIAGNPRVFNSTIDIGAYESQVTPCPFTTAIYVDINATSGNNDGTSWTDAYTDLQDAIDNHCGGVEIWVAQGTYLPTDAPDGTTSTGPTDRNNAFHFDTNIQIYGGFDGTETMLSERDPAAHPTVLSGDFDGLDVVTGSGSTLSITNNTENAYHVLITAGLNSTAIIDGFTIKGGNADGGFTSISYSGQFFSQSSGAGMFNQSSSPTLTHVTFSGNSANSAGGGMGNVSSSSPTLTHVTFSGNSANFAGGGMYNSFSSSPTLTNVTFSGNSAAANGGGMENNNSSSPTLYNTVFYGNTAPTGNDINGDNINASSSHNASDGTGGNISMGANFVNLTSDPFTNSSDPDGADDLWMTADDGLVPAAGSPLVDAGDNTRNSETTDIAGNPRVFNTTIDIGAYESQVTPCPFTTAIYVDIDATSGNNDGTSWTDAYTDLQDAIDNHCGGVEIWVAQGTYLPTDAPDGTTSTGPTDRNNAFHFDTNIQIYGGFDGTETMLSQRDPAAHPTVLSGDFDGLDVVTGSGSTLSITNNTENAYHVLITAGLNSTAIIDGFTIKGGNADGSGSISYSGQSIIKNDGGGMYNASSSPTLTHVTFSGNSADFSGGGMINRFSSPTLTHVTFSGNSANLDGGGMSNISSSSPTLTHVTFSGNSAFIRGGGMFNFSSSSPTLTHVTFSGNYSDNDGGGMNNEDASSPTLTHVTFSGNSAGSSGGGMYNEDASSSPTLTHVTFSGNSADFSGGGMENASSSPTLTHVTFSGNAADVVGGGMRNISSSPTLTNVTFSGNAANGGGGGGMFNTSSSSPTLYNTVFYGNTATSGNDDIAGNINTSSSHNASDGTGGNISMGANFVNLTSDPFTNSSDPDGADDLWMTADDGLVPAAGSPLVDAGDNTRNSEPTDIAGNPRVFNTTIDIGAYEYQAPPCPTTIFVDSAATTGANDGSSWADAYTDLQDAIDNHCGAAEIWVAAGTYKPTDAPDGTTSTGPTDRNNAFHFDTNIKIYGGFDGTETMLSQRDPAAHPTVLSGDFDGLDVVTGSGSTLSITGNGDNAYHVLITAGLNSTAIIDGFTIKGGNADGGNGSISYSGKSFGKNNGGGMFNVSSSPTLTHVTFSGNSAADGAGMKNLATSSPTVTNCSFSENKANSKGGGMHNDSGSNPTVTGCSFTGNATGSDGGGMWSWTQPQLTNCSFIGNHANDGGGMYIVNNPMTATNCTFSNNTASTQGGGISSINGSPTLTNCIVWGNTASSGPNIYVTPGFSQTPTYSHSLIQGSGGSGNWDTDFGTDNGNNLDEDPLFTDPANGDFSLQQCSPAIDAGINDSIPAGVTTDLAGDARRYNSGTVDMGAYEFQSAKPSPTMSCLSSETVQLDANGSYSLAASDLDNGSNGACGSLSFTIEGNAAKTFSCSELGANTITLTATDQDNQAIGTCQVSVTVQDIQTPTARCQPATVSLDANGQASLAASQVDNGSSDNCQLSLSVSPSSFDCSQVGSQNVTLTVTDQAGNSASCATSVQVVDDIKPSLNCPVTPVDLQADAQGNINIPDLSAQISPTDNCGTISSITHAQGLRSVIGSCPANNFEDLRFRILDGNGNELEKTCQNFIRVQDAIKPVISCPSSPIQVTIPFDGATCQPGTVSLSLSDATQAGASVSDNIDTGVSFSQIDANSFSLSQVGQTGLSVTLRATDCFGNAADQACDVQVAAAPAFTAEWELNGGTYTVCPDAFPLSISLAQGTPACGSWSGDVNVSTNPLQLEASAFPDNDNNNLPDLGTYQITYSVGPVGAQTSKSLSLTVALTPGLSRQGCGSCNQIRMDVCQGAPAPDLQAFVQNNNPGYQTGATLHWYADAGNSQGAALPAAPSLSTANAGRQFFWVSQEAGGCESDAIRVRVWVRERSRAVLDLPTACSGTQVNLARHVSDLNGLATGYEFWDDVPGIGTLLGTVSATNGVVPANQNLFVTLASQTTTYYAVPLNPYNCQVAGSDQLSVASSTLDPVSNITVTNGDPVQVTFNTTASQVVWYNLNNPSIGLIGAAGIGNISFTAQNSGSTPLTANLFAIAYDGGCASQTQNFSITVNPGGANRQAQGDYLSLQAHRINAHDVQLRWSIRYQQPLSHFVVEKWQGQGPLPEDYLILNQESNWKVLGEVEAIGLEGSYAFTDPSGMRNQNYYRVRLVMPDGRLTWSEVVQVNMEYFQSDRFEVFPNPTKDVVQLRCKLEQFHGWSLQLSDQLGRVIRQQPIREQTSRISLREFAPGVYYLKIEGPEGKTYLRKVVRQ